MKKTSGQSGLAGATEKAILYHNNKFPLKSSHRTGIAFPDSFRNVGGLISSRYVCFEPIGTNLDNYLFSLYI